MGLHACQHEQEESVHIDLLSREIRLTIKKIPPSVLCVSTKTATVAVFSVRSMQGLCSAAAVLSPVAPYMLLTS